MHNNFVYVITWYLSFTVRKTGAASWSSPKWLASRIGPPNSQCSGAAPGKVMNLKFSGNVPNLVLGKVRKFQHRSFSGFGDIPEKPEGWIKTTPPATNRVNPHRTFRFSEYRGGVGGWKWGNNPLRRFAPNWARASRKKRSCASLRNAAIGLRFKDQGQPMTSEVRSSGPRHRFGFW